MIKFFIFVMMTIQAGFVFAENDFVSLTKKYSNRIVIGSGVQWNDEYVVTAKHNDFVENIVYKCPNSCDIMFVKMKAKNPAPEWREATENENLTIVGQDVNLKHKVSKGKDLNTYVSTSRLNKDLNVYLASNLTEGGMSGGPVYGDDGKALGILTGGILEPQLTPELIKLNNGKMVTLYIPYSEIQKQWELFQKENQELLNKS